MRVKINYNELPKPIVAPGGECAWDITGIIGITKQAKDNNWIILGGDVITAEGKYNWDSWYYQIDKGLSVRQNVELSIQKCLSYVNQYIARNGCMFYFVPVLTHFDGE